MFFTYRLACLLTVANFGSEYFSEQKHQNSTLAHAQLELLRGVLRSKKL